MGSEFGIFGGFRWVCSSVLVDEPGLGKVQSSVFPDLGLGSAWFWPNRFEVTVHVLRRILFLGKKRCKMASVTI